MSTIHYRQKARHLWAPFRFSGELNVLSIIKNVTFFSYRQDMMSLNERSRIGENCLFTTLSIIESDVLDLHNFSSSATLCGIQSH